jgi:hypothetical protein
MTSATASQSASASRQPTLGEETNADAAQNDRSGAVGGEVTGPLGHGIPVAGDSGLETAVSAVTLLGRVLLR